MKLSFADLQRWDEPLHLVVHSLEQALYQVTIKLDGKEHLLVENNGKTFRRNALGQVKEALQPLQVASLALRHSSAYDEMVGQPPKQGPNTLEVPLSLEPKE